MQNGSNVCVNMSQPTTQTGGMVGFETLILVFEHCAEFDRLNTCLNHICGQM